jgi:acetyl esterase/lipase
MRVKASGKADVMKILNKAILSSIFLIMLSGGFTAYGDIVFEEGITFANPDGQEMKLNLARPAEGDGPFPAVVCVHGGGWWTGERERWDDLCKELAARGYVAITVDYRLTPDGYPWPAPIEDVKAGVRWLRAKAKKFKVDTNRIGTIGDSAGGQLALMLALTADVDKFEGDGGNEKQSSAVACAVSYYGPSDLTRSYEASVDAAEVLPNFLGGNLQENRKAHIDASPLYWVTPNAAPILIVQGTEDPYVNHDHAVWLYGRLRAAEVDAKLLTIEGAGHGFRGEHGKIADAAMLAFFDKHLKN